MNFRVQQLHQFYIVGSKQHEVVLSIFLDWSRDFILQKRYNVV